MNQNFMFFSKKIIIAVFLSAIFVYAALGASTKIWRLGEGRTDKGELHHFIHKINLSQSALALS